MLDLSKPEFRAVHDRFMVRLTEIRERLGQLERLIATGDDEVREEIRRTAHRLSGSAGTFGFAALGTDARALEALLSADRCEPEGVRAQLHRLLAAIDQCHDSAKR